LTTNKGSAELAVGEVTLFGTKFERYVLWAKEDSEVTITTGCDCKEKKAD
jgi:hypothetical protein